MYIRHLQKKKKTFFSENDMFTELQKQFTKISLNSMKCSKAVVGYLHTQKSYNENIGISSY